LSSGGDSAKWSASFTPIGNTGTSPSISVTDRNDGTYTLSYMPTGAGVYEVTGTTLSKPPACLWTKHSSPPSSLVYYNGNAISGMPLRITVQPAAIDATKSDVSGFVTVRTLYSHKPWLS
jgi:hypothetical protein